jgi:hypothetical protein
MKKKSPVKIPVKKQMRTAEQVYFGLFYSPHSCLTIQPLRQNGETGLTTPDEKRHWLFLTKRQALSPPPRFSYLNYKIFIL